MKKGIIFEINDAFLILLTPDGQFLQTKNQGQSYQIGQEIDFIPLEKNAGKTFRFTLVSKLSSVAGKRIAAAAIVLLVLTASLFPVYQDNKVFAYMTIDNASSVELAVNKDLEVIELIPYNKQGEKIVDNLDEWKKQDLSAVSNKVLKEMEKQGIKQDEVIFSTVFEGNRNQDLDKHLNKEIEVIKEYTKDRDTQITLVSGTTEDRKQAIKQGKTTGEYKQELSQNQKDKAKAKQQKNPKAKHDIEKQQPMQNNLPNQPAPDAKENKKVNQDVEIDHPKKENPNKNKIKEKLSKPEKQKEKRQDGNSNQSNQNQKQGNVQNPKIQQQKLGFGIEKSGLIVPGLFFP